MPSLNTLWAQAIVQELHRSGVRYAVVCPGSRSTPLALAFAEHGGIRTLSVIDERTAAFLALGIALESGAPAAVLCTSGTAGAHFYPAVIEAAAAHVPMVVLTADRPSELHGFGAPQTISQQQIYGRFPVGCFDLGAPEATDASFIHVRSVVSRAAALCQRSNRGPVHLNVPFREPLAEVEPVATPAGLSPTALHGREDRPFTQWNVGKEVSRQALSGIAARIQGAERGIIVCGPRAQQDGLAPAVAALSKATGYPIIAEAASSVRYSSESGPVLSHYDLLLRTDFAKEQRPELIIRIGGGLTSKRVTEWLHESQAPSILLSDDGEAFDPAHQASDVLVGHVPQMLEILAEQVTCAPSGWSGTFHQAHARVASALEDAFARQLTLSEPRIAHEVVHALAEGTRLFLASSMPVRDVDAFAAGKGKSLRVFSNRGVNGIDGTLSSALGVSLASGKPTVVLSGDLAFLHDLNGLLIAKRGEMSLTVVVVNNDGGGIFSFLPVAKIPKHFEDLFGTPHGLELSHAAALFGARYLEPKTPQELREAVRTNLGRGLSVLNVKVERQQNVAEHQKLYAQIQAALSGGAP